MKVDLEWKGKMAFEAITPSGASFVIDTYRDSGGEQSGPTPIELLVTSLGTCTAMDVVMILQKMRQPIESYRIEVEWERGPKDIFPRPITKFIIKHFITGVGLDKDAVAKAIKLSDEKYCSVAATLRTPAEIVTEWSVD